MLGLKEVFSGCFASWGVSHHSAGGGGFRPDASWAEHWAPVCLPTTFAKENIGRRSTQLHEQIQSLNILLLAVSFKICVSVCVLSSHWYVSNCTAAGHVLGAATAGYVGGAVITLLYASAVHLWPMVDVIVAYVFGSLQCNEFEFTVLTFVFVGIVVSPGTSIQNTALRSEIICTRNFGARSKKPLPQRGMSRLYRRFVLFSCQASPWDQRLFTNPFFTRSLVIAFEHFGFGVPPAQIEFW